ncbi:hypothetical protein AZE42_08595 [Rhizopogon vesiculosus]|uniref:Crinkler effector protein N-terminal domain-containing protein n=1 Tax=Rhizopogon vesiculosus TaxID=180088 RepID=A0A1J8QPJ0_9AGAM|nr:hypothetical protein AZE42_08595 [Rhizopogon vesiculosus]
MKSNYTLNCIVFGKDPSQIFPIKIASTKTVYALKKMIKEKLENTFCDVNARNIKLWEVKNMLAEDALQDNLKPHLEEKPLSPVAELFEVFYEPPKKGRLHIVVRGPPTGHIATVIPFLKRRAAYLKKRTGAPSEWARPAQFAKLQFHEAEYLCNRPRDAADPVPVTLLEPIFAQFVDDCREYQPTAKDSQFIRGLSEEMCKYYGSPDERVYAFRQIFRYLNIKLTADTIGSSKWSTDGHLLSTCGKFAVVVVVGNNEIGSGSGDPFAQAMMYYRMTMEDSWAEITNLRSIVPSFLIIVFGEFDFIIIGLLH